MPYLAQVVLQYKSNLPKDVTVNDFVFGEATPGSFLGVVTDIVSFYNVIASGAYSIAQLLGEQIDRNAGASKIKFYDLTGKLDGSAHGSPVYETTWQLGAEHASGEPSMPEEVAICASFYGSLAGLSEEVGATRPKQRHRGRVFLGPVNNLTMTSDSTTKRRVVHPMAQTTIRAACLALAASTHQWSVWSRRNAATYPVTGGFIDDAFDTQRRRGTKATGRNTWGTAS
jgi:hypothetical protein